jgi:hypothetical protein
VWASCLPETKGGIGDFPNEPIKPKRAVNTVTCRKIMKNGQKWGENSAFRLASSTMDSTETEPDPTHSPRATLSSRAPVRFRFGIRRSKIVSLQGCRLHGGETINLSDANLYFVMDDARRLPRDIRLSAPVVQLSNGQTPASRGGDGHLLLPTAHHDVCPLPRLNGLPRSPARPTPHRNR